TSGGKLFPYVNDAMYYILARAGTTPVVVNLSYGTTSGPHDGSSDFETAMDAYIAARKAVNAPLAVVLPSGNSRLLRGHAHFDLKAGAAKELVWRILPDDATPSHVEIWLPPKAGSGSNPALEVKVTPPGNVEGPPIQEGQPSLEWPTTGQVLCQVTYINASLTGHRGMILISVAPTATHDPLMDVAPSGTWKISLKNIGNAPITDIRAWVRRDDTPYGYPQRGRQSRLEDPGFAQFDDAGRQIEDDTPSASDVRRDGTINALATGKRTIVVAGMRRDCWRPSNYAAGGVVVKPPGRGAPTDDGPDVTTVSDDSSIYNGLLGSGTRSGSIVAINGTSVAAPQITRWLVEQMAAGSGYERTDATQFAKLGTPPSPWPNSMTEAAPPTAAPGLSTLAPERVGDGRIEFPPRVDRQMER
ncbi:MAG TPA: hypothetical protein VJT77_05140, partial [Burkholderiales bacterium]|nr:hypothetical protein [Burkholderiales bacterium]